VAWPFKATKMKNDGDDVIGVITVCLMMMMFLFSVWDPRRVVRNRFQKLKHSTRYTRRLRAGSHAKCTAKISRDHLLVGHGINLCQLEHLPKMVT
jgi:hypothetical protein